MKTVKYKTNINCGLCIKAVTFFLYGLHNIDNWKVDTENPNKVLEVVYDDDDETTVMNAVKEAGFRIESL